MFFTQFNQLMAGSVDITLVIRKSATGMTVSVLPKSNGLKDEAQNHIVPLTLSGTPEELDGGFFQTIARPVQKVSGLLTNMAEFEKQADKTAKDSKAAKEVKAKETKEEKEKREKYEKLIKKADELATAKNHKEAVTVLGQAKAYANPQQAKEIEEKIKAQTAELNKGSLFGMEAFDQQPTPQPAPQPQPQLAPHPRPLQGQAPGNIPPQPHPASRGQQPARQPIPPRQPVQQPAPYPGVQQPYHAQPYPGQGGQYPQPNAYGQQPAPQPLQSAAGFDGDMPQYDGYSMMEDGPSSYGQDEPDYNPEEYANYPDFPMEMLKSGNRYQTTNQQM